MFVDTASRWMRPYGMKSKSETTVFVQRFLADMNDMGTPRCFRTDNGGEFTSRSYTDFAVSTQHQGSHSKMRWSRAPYGAQ